VLLCCSKRKKMPGLSGEGVASKQQEGQVKVEGGRMRNRELRMKSGKRRRKDEEWRMEN
jgi:hypothetical protein